MATPKILIIYTGGTIGMGKDPVTGVLEPLDFNHLVSSMPEFKLIQAEIDVRKFDPPIDSSDMDPMRWAEIVSMIANNYNDYDGFVILHGTDTMAYTSSLTARRSRFRPRRIRRPSPGRSSTSMSSSSPRVSSLRTRRLAPTSRPEPRR